MFRIISATLFAICVSGLFNAHVQAETSLKGLSKDKFLKAQEAKMEGIWESYSLLYTRINPEIKELVPGKEWNEEDRIASACIYDEMTRIGKLDEYIESIEQLDMTTVAIEANSEINLFNLSEYPEIEQMPAIDGYMEAMTSCGQLELMQKRMAETGIWEKLMQSVPK